jgi:hypothetical protein
VSSAITRRSFLALSAAALVAVATVEKSWGAELASRQKDTTYLTTDFAVPPIDSDDFYDVACAIALGYTGIVLDTPTDAATQAINDLGGTVVAASELATADTVVVVGAATNAARCWHRGQRVVLFAGDATPGEPDESDYNVTLDPEAYRFLRPKAHWVPCDDGGLWQASTRASFMHTDDEALLDGAPCRWWFEKYVTLGPRNLWCGPLLRFAFTDTWRGQTVADGSFLGNLDFDEVMIAGTRDLLAKLPSSPSSSA